MTEDHNQRRTFFLEASGSLGRAVGKLRDTPAGFVANKISQVLSAFSGEAGAEAAGAKQVQRKLVLRSLDAVTSAGEPLGLQTRCGVFWNYGFSQQPRGLLVLGHGTGSREQLPLHLAAAGISVLDFYFNEKSKMWNWDAASKRNLRFQGGHLLPVELQEGFSEEQGIGNVQCAVLTPWDTVLFGEHEILELSLDSATLARKRHLGLTNAQRLYLYAVAGRAVVLYALCGTAELGYRVAKYISRGVYDPRDRKASAKVFWAENAGQLLFADFSTGQWTSTGSEISTDTVNSFHWSFLKEADWPEVSTSFTFELQSGIALPLGFPRVLSFELEPNQFLEVLCEESDSKIFSKCLF